MYVCVYIYIYIYIYILVFVKATVLGFSNLFSYKMA
jgi:hypothetical protein